MATMEVEVKIISKETIKPSSSTPHHLKTFNLSVFDQLSPSDLYPSLLFFYQNAGHGDHQDRRLCDLKSSLSETLTRFYPLAGRIIKNELFIDCTDEGVDFLEAKVSGCLPDILKHPDPTFLSELLPTKTMSVRDLEHAGSILLVQANLFDCGGLAIAVSISHKVADASTANLFIKGWATQARRTGELVVPDMTVIASRFPAVCLPVGSLPDWKDSLETASTCKTRRHVFDSKNINAIRAKATNASVPRPSRVEAVTGHIWQSMIKSNLENTRARSYAFVQTMDLRKRIDPPLSETSFGNLAAFFLTRPHGSDDKVIELDGLVGELRRGLQDATEYYKKKMVGQESFMAICEAVRELGVLIARDDVEIVKVSSWCRFGFYENANFGFGKPVWVSVNDWGLKNVVILMDTKDGDGIEAWVALDENDMDLFQANQDFFEFASFNPSIDLH